MWVAAGALFEPAGRPRGLGRDVAALLVLGCVGRSSNPSATSVRLLARLPRICAVRFTTRRAFCGLPRLRGCASVSGASALEEAWRSSLISEGLASACSPSEFSSLVVLSWNGLRSFTWIYPRIFHPDRQPHTRSALTGRRSYMGLHILELVLRLRPVRRTKARDFASRLCRPGYSALHGVTHYSIVFVAFEALSAAICCTSGSASMRVRQFSISADSACSSAARSSRRRREIGGAGCLPKFRKAGLHPVDSCTAVL